LIDDARLVRSDLEAIATVRGLQVIGVLTAELEHTLDGCGHVFVQAVCELDDDDGALAWRTKQPPDDSAARFAAYFAEDHFHTTKLAHLNTPAKPARKNPAIL